MRLQGKTAIVVGAGQTPGDTLGNGRATALLFAREGAWVLLVDRDARSAAETQELIQREGGQAEAFTADATQNADCRAVVEHCRAQFGRIDILHNNVGIARGDDELVQLAEDAWDEIIRVNLKSAMLPCKHVLPIMREQKSGAIINVSSLAAVAAATELTAYKVSKAGLNALTQQLAIANAAFGIRVNAIAPGLIETPMAVEGVAQKHGLSKDEVIRRRNARVPLGGKMGTAWDVAYAALFLASDEARFITGIVLPVDGGQGGRIGEAVSPFANARRLTDNRAANKIRLTTNNPRGEFHVTKKNQPKSPRLTKPRIPPVAQAAWNDAQRALLQPVADKGRLWNVHSTLAAHPKMAAAWMTFATYVLRDNSLPVRDREILILRIGRLCNAPYELAQHARIGLRAGLTDDDLRRIDEGPDAAGLSERDKLLLLAADELHEDAFLTDTTWNALADIYSTQQMMDVVFTVGEYNLVSMALNSFGVQLDEGLEPFPHSS